MTDAKQSRRFQEVALPHLDAAYNLARCASRNDDDAQDIVQEAYLRVQVVRRLPGRERPVVVARDRSQYLLHGCGSIAARSLEVPYDDDGQQTSLPGPIRTGTPAIPRRFRRERGPALFDAALRGAADESREAVVLRDVEDLSAKEIASVAAIPIGTVMSRLARGRGCSTRRSRGCARE